MADHRITEWLRLKGTSEVIWSTPIPLKQGQIQPLVQDNVQTVFVYLLGQRLRSLFGEFVSVLGQSHSEEGFPDIRGNLMFHLVIIVFGLLSGHE